MLFDRHLVKFLVHALIAAVFLPAAPGESRAAEKPRTEIIANSPHGAYITALAVTPDDRFVISAGYDNTLKLWSLDTRRVLRTFTGHTRFVNSVVLTPDGRRFVSGSADGTVRIWEIETGKLLRTIDVDSDSHFSFMGSVSLIKNGSQIRTNAKDTYKYWDLETGRLVRSLPDVFKGKHGFRFLSDDRMGMLNYKGTVIVSNLEASKLIATFKDETPLKVLTATPDGKRIVGMSDKGFWIWNPLTTQPARWIKQTGIKSTCEKVRAHMTTDGSLLVVVCDKGLLKVVDLDAGVIIHSLEMAGCVGPIELAPDGKRMVVVCDDRILKIIDLEGGTVTRSLTLDRKINRLKLTHSGTRALTNTRQSSEMARSDESQAGDDRIFQYWDLDTGRQLTKTSMYPAGVQTVAVTPNEETAIAKSADRMIRIWDLTSGKLARTIPIGDGDVLKAIVPLADNQHFMTAGTRSSVGIWDIRSGLQVRSLTGPNGKVRSLATTSDGRTAIAGDKDGKLWIWDLKSGKLRLSGQAHRYGINSIIVTADDQRFISLGGGKQARIWDINTGKPIRTFERVGQTVGDTLALTRDGRTLVVGHQYGWITLRNARTGKLIHTFEGQSAGNTAPWFTTVLVSPDDRHALYQSSSDFARDLKVIDIESGKLVRSLKPHSGPIGSFVLLPKQNQILSAGLDGTLKLLDLQTTDTIITMVASGKHDYLTISKEGFFDASATGGELLSVVRGLEGVSVGQLYQSLFNPDLVRVKLAGDPHEELRLASSVLNLDKVLDSGQAPSITISEPRPNSSTTKEVVTITAQIKDEGGGIGRVEWRVNGVTAAVTTPNAGATSTAVSQQDLALDPGENSVAVIAYNRRNLLASVPVTTNVSWTGNYSEKPKLHVLAIGINKYTDRGWTPPGRSKPVRFPKLSLARKDAITLAANLKKATGDMYGDVQITLALDEEATRANLDRIVDRLERTVHPRDTFIFFAAAHGTSKDGRFYLIPQDYQHGPHALAKRAVGQDVLQDWLGNRIKAKKALILLDTCESGALIAGHVRSRSDTLASEASLGRLHEATGRPVLTAAAAGQFAHEGLIASAGDRHGVFTWALLDALRNGDSNKNALIELSELANHVQRVVPKLAAQLGGVGRAAIAAPRPKRGDQAARFGSRGEDFAIAAQLQ